MDRCRSEIAQATRGLGCSRKNSGKLDEARKQRWMHRPTVMILWKTQGKAPGLVKASEEASETPSDLPEVGAVHFPE